MRLTLCGNGERFGKPAYFQCFKLFCRIGILCAHFDAAGAGFKAGGDDGHEAGGFVFGYERKRARAFPLHLSLKLKLPIL